MYAALFLFQRRGDSPRQGQGGRQARQGDTMKADIHPAYDKVSANCSCGNVIETRSTLAKNLHIDVCSKCHPYYTGKQKVMDTGGRIDRFKKRFGAVGARRQD